MGPNLKRNKTLMVLNCIYFHWKITLFCTILSPSGIFTSEVTPYLIHEIHGDGWPWKYVLLGTTASLSKQTVYWSYPVFTASLHPGFCMFWERDCSQDQTRFPLGCSLISPSCQWQGSVPELALECLSAGLSERNLCVAGRWTDAADSQVPSISGVLLAKQEDGPSPIFLGLRHRNVMDTCVFYEGFFNSIVL